MPRLCIYAVKLLSGPSLALSGVIIWSKVVSLSGPSLRFSLFLLWFQAIFETLNYDFVFFCAQLSRNFLKIAFFKKKGCKNCFFC